MITTLHRVARNVIRESWLVCPNCGSDVRLRGSLILDGDSLYVCVGPCRGVKAAGTGNFDSLQPLRAVAKGKR